MKQFKKYLDQPNTLEEAVKVRIATDLEISVVQGKDGKPHIYDSEESAQKKADAIKGKVVKGLNGEIMVQVLVDPSLRKHLEKAGLIEARQNFNWGDLSGDDFQDILEGDPDIKTQFIHSIYNLKRKGSGFGIFMETLEKEGSVSIQFKVKQIGGKRTPETYPTKLGESNRLRRKKGVKAEIRLMAVNEQTISESESLNWNRLQDFEKEELIDGAGLSSSLIRKKWAEIPRADKKDLALYVNRMTSGEYSLREDDVEEEIANTTAGVAGLTPDTVGVPVSATKKRKKRKEVEDMINNKISESTRSLLEAASRVDQAIKRLNTDGTRMFVNEIDGHPVFRVTANEFNKCSGRRSKGQRWIRFFESDSRNVKSIREYSKKHPNKPVIVQNEVSGEVALFRRSHGDRRLKHNRK